MLSIWSKRSRIGEGGMTLLEIIVVLAVIALLGAALMPMVLGYLEDAKRSKAESEVKVIAAALASLTKDLRHFPAYTGTNNSGVAEIELLCSAGSLPEKAQVKGQGDQSASIGGWSGIAPGNCRTSGKVETLENVLITNSVEYNTTKRDKGMWKGPYGDRFNMADPWERAYVVNMKNGEIPDGLSKVIWVLSAGPNAVIDTPGDSLITIGNLVPEGDDIAIRLK